MYNSSAVLVPCFCYSVFLWDSFLKETEPSGNQEQIRHSAEAKHYSTCEFSDYFAGDLCAGDGE
uniref:Uncharacterized protein n=1 Tax=Arundo donax TaxID=35708 RepID=A0A0A9AKN3_ARUDO